MENLQLTQD